MRDDQNIQNGRRQIKIRMEDDNKNSKLKMTKKIQNGRGKKIQNGRQKKNSKWKTKKKIQNG